MPTAPETPPPGWPVKLWFITPEVKLVSRWARERPNTWLLKAPVWFGRTIDVADGHHLTARDALEYYITRQRRNAKRRREWADRCDEKANTAEKLMDELPTEATP